MKSSGWEEINGFNSPGEYKRFIAYIEDLIARKLVAEVAVDDTYGRGEIYGGRWFKDAESSEIWRLVAPDFPFRGLWEPVIRD